MGISAAGARIGHGVKLTGVVGLVLGATVALGGCASSGPMPTAGAAGASTEATVQRALTDAEYLKLAHDEMGVGADQDAALLRIADTTCLMLVGESIRGPLGDPLTWKPWKAVIDQMTASGVDAKDAGELVVYAVAHSCPEKAADYLPPA